MRGHSYRVLHQNAGNAVPLKDTIIVNQMERIEVEFLADNPGDWAFHCHNAYHMETGMMRVFKYV
jgi:FtsP/CotA-like multicopper oxidase with cupredoxin domain